MKDVEWRKRIKRKRQKYFVCIYFSKSHHTDLLQSFPDILALTFAILLTLTHVGVGGGGVSGLGAISSSGATSGLSANILSKSICPKDRGVLISTDQSYVTDQMCHSQKNKHWIWIIGLLTSFTIPTGKAACLWFLSEALRCTPLTSCFMSQMCRKQF